MSFSIQLRRNPAHGAGPSPATILPDPAPPDPVLEFPMTDRPSLTYRDAGVDIDAGDDARGTHQAAGTPHDAPRGAGRHRRFRRAGRAPARPLAAPGAGFGHRRSGHQAAPGHRHRSARHRRGGPGRDVRQRRRGPGSRAAVLPGLLRDRQAGRGRGGEGDRRHRGRLRHRGLRPGRRRDSGNARHVRGRRLRPGRILRRRRGEGADPRRDRNSRRRRRHRPGFLRSPLERLFPDPQAGRAGRRRR